MKIQLDYKIDIEVQEGGKQKEKLSIFYREFTKAETKENEAMRKQFEGIFKKAQKIGKKQAVLDKKISLFESNGDYESALKAVCEKEELDEQSEALADEVEELGGGDQVAFNEELSKKRFDTLVSGKDKEKFEEYALIKGYSQIVQNLDTAKRELEKKQSGE